MKRAFVLVTVLVVTLLSLGCLISCGAPEAEEPVILRLAGALPPMEVMPMEADAMAARFNERAGGRYIIETHHAEELVKINESLDAVRKGVVEISYWPIGMFGGVDMRFSAVEIPFLYNNIHAQRAANELFLPLYGEVLEEGFNQKALNCVGAGCFQIGGNKPVKTLEDWDGLLIQSGSPVISDVIEILGGSPVPIPPVEGYQALEKGVVDATLQYAPWWIQNKAYEVSSHITLVYLVGASLTMSINLDVYNSLPKDIQDILLEESLVMQQRASEAFIKQDEETPGQLAEFGMEVYVLDKAERDRWQEMLRPYNDELVAAMGDFGQEVMQIADQVNSEYPY